VVEIKKTLGGRRELQRETSKRSKKVDSHRPRGKQGGTYGEGGEQRR